VAKVRVYELAKDVGMDSKDVLAKLQEMGEFVRSASSTVEPPVVRKFLEKFPPVAKPAAEEKPAKKAPAKKAAAKKAAVDKAPAEAAVESPAIPETPVTPPVSKPTTPPVTQVPQTPPARPTNIPSPIPQRPGNNPFGTPNAPRPPRPQARPGNNPFGTSGGPRPPRPQGAGGAPQRPGSPRGGNMAGPRPGSVRPGFAARPQQRPDGSQRPQGGQGGQGGRFGGAPSSSPYRTQGGPQRPGGAGGKPGGGGFAPGRPGQRPGGAGGAFGKNAGKKKNYKSKKTRREEIDNMQAPTLGGAVVPRGDGNTPIKLRRGASLADFAEKIGADPAALVSVLFHLGEMVTATQSVDEDTLHVLGSEFGYKITVVSPEGII
jgi:translation initiation factor IF-2